MPVYLCRWADGDFSIVFAPNRSAAIEQLDEFANADGLSLIEIKEFMAHFRLTEQGTFEFGEFGEATGEQILQKAYPLLDAVQTVTAGEETQETKRLIQKTVAEERERVKAQKVEARTPEARFLQEALDVPAAMANRIDEEHGIDKSKR